MDTIERSAIPALAGTPFGGGFFVERYMQGGHERALIVAPKAEGYFESIWHKSRKDVPGALSYDDGMGNTVAMAEAGSAIAKKVLGLKIGGVDGWHIPAQDQLELCYRVLKPTTTKNYLWARSGINLSALPPTRPYLAEFPKQTLLPLFQEGGAEAFHARWHWTSTQRAHYAGWAWMQAFDDGYQNYGVKDYSYWVCAVRSVIIH